MKDGILVLGHGSRRAEANKELKEIVAMLQKKNNALLVAGGYIEFAEPSMEVAMEQLIAQGAKRIAIVPMFLTLGNHLQQTVPDRLFAIATRYPMIEITQTKHLGADPLIVEIIENRIKNAW